MLHTMPPSDEGPVSPGGSIALVIDDDAGTRLMAHAVLAEAGFRVVESADGDDGLAAFDRARPDIVLLDLVMPGRDGFSTCEALRQRPGGAHLPILVMTGLDDGPSIERAYLAGATDFIAKPISWPVLVQRMRYMMRASRAFLDLEQSRAHLAARVVQSQAFEERASTLLHLFKMGGASQESELFAYALDQARRLTGSVLAYVHLLDETASTVLLSRWSWNGNAVRGAGQRTQCRVADAGIAVACARTRESLIDNNCHATMAIHGQREVPIQRLLSVPVVEEQRVCMILGVANKAGDYGQFDAETVRLIANDLWQILYRTRAEAQLRTLSRVVEESPVSVVITDSRGAIEYVNPGFVATTGYSLDEVRGRNPRILKSGLTSAATYTEMWQTLARGGQWHGELCNRRKNGELYWEQVSIAGMAEESGVITHYVAVKEDITDRKRMEGEIRELNEGLEKRVAERTAELERANAELDAFSFSVSHDLRAPLRAMAGFSDILATNEAARLTPHGQQLLERVVSNCGRMSQMIDDLLRLSRLGRAALELAPVDLAAVAAEVARPLAAEYPAARLDIGPLPVVPCDAGLIAQVFQNLLANALKYSARRPDPLITVTARCEAGEVIVCVGDNGVGFDMKYAARLFGVFQRLHNQYDFPGTGVGLAIVARIVQRHRGRVWATGARGEGAKFCFSLPVEANAVAAPTPASRAASPPEPA